MRTWIRNPLAVYGPDAAAGGVVVQDGWIAELIGSGRKPTAQIDTVVDASDQVLLPGLINTHHHYYQTLTRAHPGAINKALFPWLKSLYPIWANLDADMIRASTELACAELLLSGCTTSVDHHYLFTDAIPDAIDIQVEAVRDIGIRSVLTRGSMSLGEDVGGLPPRSTVQAEQIIVDDSVRLINAYHDPSTGSLLQIALAPCSPFSVTPDLMRETARLADNHQVQLHTHLAETRDETAFCLREFDASPLDYLEQVGWMRAGVWLAHGIHFSDADIVRLGAAGVGICHCPGSNMLLGSGQCRARELHEAGCPVGIGVDGSASNDSSNMIQEVRQSLLLQRLRYGADKVSHLDVFEMATRGSARCLGRDDIGEIAVGKQADLALFGLDELRFSGYGDALAALLLCGASKAEAVMVGGDWKVRDGVLQTRDTAALASSHRAAARRLVRGE